MGEAERQTNELGMEKLWNQFEQVNKKVAKQFDRHISADSIHKKPVYRFINSLNST